MTTTMAVSAKIGTGGSSSSAAAALLLMPKMSSEAFEFD
jgi:hypothetical protein